MSKYYIAYGSNLSMEQMAIRCPNAVPVGTSVLKNWKLVFKTHATIEPCWGASVPVGIWEITGDDEHALDRYEGYPAYYHKQILNVYMKSFVTRRVRKISASVYIMNDINVVSPPTHSYYKTIESGYEDFGLNKLFLTKAIDDSMAYYHIDNQNV